MKAVVSLSLLVFLMAPVSALKAFDFPVVLNHHGEDELSLTFVNAFKAQFTKFPGNEILSESDTAHFELEIATGSIDPSGHALMHSLLLTYAPGGNEPYQKRLIQSTSGICGELRVTSCATNAATDYVMEINMFIHYAGSEIYSLFPELIK